MTQLVNEHPKCLNLLSWYDVRFLPVLYDVTNSFLLREPTPSFYTIHFTNWCAKCLFPFSQDCSLLSAWVFCTGSASDWCAIQEVLYKCIDTRQYNTIANECAPHKEFHHKTFWPSGRYRRLSGYDGR